MNHTIACLQDPDTIYFDPESTKTVMICGTKNSGKSTLLKFLTDKIVKDVGIYRVYIFSGTAEFNPIYKNWTPYVYPLDFDRIAALLERQKILATAAMNNPKIKLPKILIILDDYVGIINMQSKAAVETFNMLATQGRHRGIITAYISHKFSANTNIVRNATDYIFCTKVDIDSIQDKTTGVYAQQTDYNSPQELWRDYVKNTKEKYSFMMIQKVDPYSDGVMWYAPINTQKKNSFHRASELKLSQDIEVKEPQPTEITSTELNQGLFTKEEEEGSDSSDE